MVLPASRFGRDTPKSLKEALQGFTWCQVSQLHPEIKQTHTHQSKNRGTCCSRLRFLALDFAAYLLARLLRVPAGISKAVQMLAGGNDGPKSLQTVSQGHLHCETVADIAFGGTRSRGIRSACRRKTRSGWMAGRPLSPSQSRSPFPRTRWPMSGADTARRMTRSRGKVERGGNERVSGPDRAGSMS